MNDRFKQHGMYHEFVGSIWIIHCILAKAENEWILEGAKYLMAVQWQWERMWSSWHKIWYWRLLFIWLIEGGYFKRN